MRLVFGEGIFEQVRRVVYDTSDETGVMLFGRKDGKERVVTAIGAPGPNATHTYGHYSGDAECASDFFAKLRHEDPQLEWLGERHAHPPGMPLLSRGDLITIAEILLGTDKDTYHPDEFVAGVMLRRNGTVDIYPVYFTKANLEGSEMELQHDSICQEPSGARTSVAKAYRHCRHGERRKRDRRNGRADRRGPNDARGSGKDRG